MKRCVAIYVYLSLLLVTAPCLAQDYTAEIESCLEKAKSYIQDLEAKKLNKFHLGHAESYRQNEYLRGLADFYLKKATMLKEWQQTNEIIAELKEISRQLSQTTQSIK